MSDDWLHQLEELYEADKAREQAKIEQAQQSEQARLDQAVELLRQVRAHELLRLMQKHLLNGGGSVGIFEKSGEYDRAVVLAWQGPLSKARRANPKDPEDYQYIAVGVREGTLLVNGQPVSPATPTRLKAALLEAAKNPAISKRKKPKTGKA